MKKCIAVPVALLSVAALATSGLAAGKKAAKGEALFSLHCAVCHPDGGNIVNPQKNLRKAELEKRGIKSWKEIVKTMRKPGPGMTAFDAKTIPDKDARAIAEFVLQTYK